MEEDSSQTVTRLLREARSGQKKPGQKDSGEEPSGSLREGTLREEALREGALYEEIHAELQRRARRQRRRWKGEPTLRTTALAHEAYLKLVGQEEQSWKSRSHFLAVAGTAMRHVLIDRARRKQAQKRGGRAKALSLEELRERLGREVALTQEDAEAFVLLDEALGRLEEKRPRAARAVECRFFSGMTIEETAEALGVSRATVSRDWKQAKTWLYREMKRIRGAGAAPKEGAASKEGAAPEGGEGTGEDES